MKPILLLLVALVLRAQPEVSASTARRAGELVVARRIVHPTFDAAGTAGWECAWHGTKPGTESQGRDDR